MLSSGSPVWTVSIKKNIDVADLQTTASSGALHDVPLVGQDAVVVRRLRRMMGAAIRSSMHELAFGVTGLTSADPIPTNPVDPTHIPGGSSSETAVHVATGVARLGVGTDTGGSIRIPAAYTGVYGLKLARDSDLMGGVLPLSPTLDHIGLVANSTDDLLEALRAIHPDAASAAPASFVTWPDDSSHSHPPFEAVLRRLDSVLGPMKELQLPFSRDAVVTTTNTVMFAEAAAVLLPVIAPGIELVGADVRTRLEEGHRIPAREYRDALAHRNLIESESRQALRDAAVLIEPTTPCRVPRLSEAMTPTLARGMVRYTRLANAAGLPSITVPVVEGRQLTAIQLTAIDERAVLAAADSIRSVLS